MDASEIEDMLIKRDKCVKTIDDLSKQIDLEERQKSILANQLAEVNQEEYEDLLSKKQRHDAALSRKIEIGKKMTSNLSAMKKLKIDGKVLDFVPCKGFY